MPAFVRFSSDFFSAENRLNFRPIFFRPYCGVFLTDGTGVFWTYFGRVLDECTPHRLTPPGSHLRPRHAHGRSTWVHCQDIYAHLHHLASFTPRAPLFSAHSVARPCGVCFTKRYSPTSILPVALRHGGLICSLGAFKTSRRDQFLIPPPLPIPRMRFHVHACVFSARW